MEFLSGEHVWERLQVVAASAARRRVAIAYAGWNAPQKLGLGVGDSVVVNGGANALAAGSTHPKALAEWLRAGAAVWSLEDLHAKVVLLEQHDATWLAAVGSANISDHSNDVLQEAVLLTSDLETCEAVSDQLDRWVAQAKRVDTEWLRRATALFREPPRHAPQRVGNRPICIDGDAPLWIGTWAPAPDQISAETQAAVAQAERTYGKDARIEWWILEKGDDRLIEQGHNVVLVRLGAGRDEPAGQAVAWPPAKVVRVIPGAPRQLPVAVLASDPGQSTQRFAPVRHAIEAAGGTVDWRRPLPANAAQAVYRLWETYDDGA